MGPEYATKWRGVGAGPPLWQTRRAQPPDEAGVSGRAGLRATELTSDISEPVSAAGPDLGDEASLAGPGGFPGALTQG
jgi:hypothetical protein